MVDQEVATKSPVLRGYRRPDGTFGVRNHLLILSSVVCANRATEMIAQAVPGAVAVTHQHGCSVIGPDMEMVRRTLAGTGKNPNCGAVLVLGLGCETIDAPGLAEEIATTGKPVDYVSIQEVGGTARAIEVGIEKARNMAEMLAAMEREPFSWDKLIFGTECGGSDTTSGLASNPVVGVAADLVVQHGGTAILSETPEIIGAEHLLAKRGRTPELSQAILDLIREVENRYLSMGVDFRGGNPSPGNIAGGLTTLEEKSLGAIHKGGTTPVNEVIGYACRPTQRGLVLMDTPGNDVESMTGMAAGGCQIMAFTTGRGTPTGNPICPVIKVTGNPETWNRMGGDMDLNASTIITGTETIEEVGARLFQLIVEVVNGRLTKAESLGHREFGITRLGMSL
ncbi:MAG: UxaA family hydrolase [Clostridia bacterium]|nr:UxaA family hydrolase [Clostridia bacterium]